jgi:DNA-binding transcriptional regulator YiaG
MIQRWHTLIALHKGEASMTSLAVALKEEIRRLARKEIKQQTGSTAQAVARYRREIAQLKRQIREHERKIVFLAGQERKRLDAPGADPEANGEARFSARSVKAQRRRSGLSAADYARLVGVSALTIYNWEHGKSRPRKEQMAALVTLRGIGKRDAQAKLELLKNGKDNSPARGQRNRRK